MLVHSTQSDMKEAPTVIQYDYKNFPDNGYQFSYKLSDGQFREESGSFINIGDKTVLQITGSYGWKNAHGKEYRVRYTSDEKGFKASVEHLPDTNTNILEPAILGLSPSLIATLAG